ncbi:MAG: hypothetical protein AB7O24_13340 [Kofleriaceae bacterium]
MSKATLADLEQRIAALEASASIVRDREAAERARGAIEAAAEAERERLAKVERDREALRRALERDPLVQLSIAGEGTGAFLDVTCHGGGECRDPYRFTLRAAGRVDINAGSAGFPIARWYRASDWKVVVSEDSSGQIAGALKRGLLTLTEMAPDQVIASRDLNEAYRRSSPRS